jgi:hypothetical protein
MAWRAWIASSIRCSAARVLSRRVGLLEFGHARSEFGLALPQRFASLLQRLRVCHRLVGR